jgi:serine protease Do
MTAMKLSMPVSMMRRGWLVAISLLACGVAGADTLPDFRALVHDNQAAVVNISTTQKSKAGRMGLPPGFDQLPENSPFREFFKHFGEGQQQPERDTHSLGSGFIISADGKILTNAHVVEGADSIIVKLNDRSEQTATVIGSDKASDVALLKIDGHNLPTVKIGDSDKLEVGEWVLAIGSPFGLEHTATQGIVSATGRSLPDGSYVPFIQTDVAVNPGNSGGPLFNTRGEVVGINSQIYSQTGGFMGLSFAIPVNIARNVSDQIEKTGHVTRGWLGVQIQNVNGDLAKSFGLDKPSGALVAAVDPKGPASRAGIKPGDVVLSYNGHEVAEASALAPMVGATAIGSTAEVKVQREGKSLVVPVKIEALKDDSKVADAGKADKESKGVLNASVAEVPQELRDRIDLKSGGVLVNEVRPGPAASAGIASGDIILQLNGKPVNGPAGLAKDLDSLPRGKPLPVLIQREEGRIFLALTLPAQKEAK